MSMSVLEKARQNAKRKWDKRREYRAQLIRSYLIYHPNETAYSLSKTLNLSLNTTQNLLKNLERNGLVIIEQVIQNGRVKNKARALIKLNKLEETNDPGLIALAKDARKQGKSAVIYMNEEGPKIELVKFSNV